ncbi:phosphatidylethanolamine-binding protein [Naematelia encephala]|uniref:Phosphatidylethanolamine-binding protein n=1 Tax=Naematelia encephala TaxID=71784 RepID=A0A1Y2BD39_9TREE|nr:phosphatidylethanolamine-binding protein [Naematelia encephala]
MFKLLSTLALAAAVSYAQNSTVSDTDLAGLEANFANAQLVPQFLSTFNPQGILVVEYNNEAITIGQNLSQDVVSSFPSILYSPGPEADTPSASDLFTIFLADANPVGTDESTTLQTRHWLVNSASLTIGDSAPYAINYANATSITDYAGPGPAAGSGAHRYVFLMYAQDSTFTAPANLSTPGTALGTWSVSDYLQETGLSNLIAANYMQVENGVATVSVAATTAVDSATLAAASTTSGSGSASTSGSGSASTSAGASQTSAATTSGASAAASSTGAAHATKHELGWGIVIGAVGITGAVLGAGLGF